MFVGPFRARGFAGGVALGRAIVWLNEGPGGGDAEIDVAEAP